MRNRIVIWGKNAEEDKVLVAANLDAVKNEVHVWVMPEKDINEEFVSSMMKDWREGKDVDLPESTKHTETELSISKGFIPEGITVDRQDIVNRAQTEWHFIVLSSKLYQSYSAEVDEIKARIDKLEDFSSGTWEELKGFWKKVQDQIYDKTLFREHANSLRKKTNELFSAMKNLRQKREEVYQKESDENRESFMEKLKGIEEKVAKGMSLQPLFEDLKHIQKKFNKSKFTRDHRRQVWNKLDKTFKDIKTKRFGSDSGKDWSPLERIERRYNGLIAAIGKMERSLQRDNSDLKYQKDKIARTDGQLEAQIREAKIKMILERVKSKQEKLDDMLKTKTQLEGGIEKEKERAAKKAEMQKIEAAKKAMEEKIASDIKDAADERKEESSKLEKAAEMIVEAKLPEEEDKDKVEQENVEKESEGVSTETKEKEEDSEKEEETIAEKIEDSVEDAIDTVKSVATVVGSKTGDKIEDLVDGVKDFFNKDGEESSVEKETSEKKEEAEKETMAEKIEDSVGDAIDTVKSVATTVGTKAEEKFEDVVEGVKDFFNKDDEESSDEKEIIEAKDQEEDSGKDEETMAEKIEDSVEDAIDTVKSVATVVADKAEDKFDDIVDSVKDFFKKDEEE